MMISIRSRLKESLNNQDGQILVGFLLIMAVGITLTLSLSSRTTTDLRSTSTTEQSTRAYNAAEAGLEDALKKIENSQVSISSVPITGAGSFGDNNYNFSAVKVGSGTKAFVYPTSVSADEAIQVWLADNETLSQLYTSDNLKIMWGNLGTAPNTSTAPGIELDLVYRNRTTGQFGIQNWYYLPTGSLNTPVGFNPSSEVIVSPITIPSINNNLGTDVSFAFSVTEGSSNGINLGKIDYAQNYPVLLRIRLLYNSDKAHVVAVMPTASATLPVSSLPDQGFMVESLGTSNSGASRKIQVFKSFANMSNIFDYGLFSGSTKKALKK